LINFIEMHFKNNHRLDLLTTPVFLLGLAILLLNDWVWKAQFSNLLSGKLSDFAGLFVFVIFWTALFPTQKRWVFGLTGLFFIFWKSPFSQPLIASWNGLGLWQIARVVDFSDNIALLSLPAAYWWLAKKQDAKPRFRLHPVLPLMVAAFAFCATSRIQRHMVELDKKVYEIEMSKSDLEDAVQRLEGVEVKETQLPKKKQESQLVVYLPNKACSSDYAFSVTLKPLGPKKSALLLKEVDVAISCPRPQKEMAIAEFERKVIDRLKNLPANFLDISHRVDSLLAKMTIEEKIGQLSLYTTDWGSTGPTIREGYKNDIRSGACGNLFNAHTTGFVRELQKIAVEETRLKIPLLFGFDVIHGYKTIFPIPLGEAASWDLGALETSARVSSAEASAAGLNWTYAPMVDIGRDPRWGRVMEGAGEDPYLGSRIAEARVRGIQGKKIGDSDAMLACVKHFAGYGAPIGGRDYNTVDMGERYFREFYLPPYEAAVRAGAATVMTSFNDYDGVPATGNKFLLDNILRKEWGFEGFIVTDYTSINEMVNHGVVANDKEAGELALNAGVDMDMQGAVYQRFLKQSLEEGKVTQAQIDEGVRRVLRLKFELGLFEDPYKFCDAEREKSTLLAPAHRAAAREVSRKSIVLLKNEQQALPLKKGQKIALIGPLADNKSELIGNWNGAGNVNDCVSLRDGIALVQSTNLSMAVGCDFENPDKAGFAEAMRVANQADVIVVAVGEKAMMSGEAAARANLGLPGVQEDLVLELCKTGKPVIVVLMNGRPLAIPRIAEKATAILETWWLGTEAGNAIADVLFGAYNPSGKLPMTFPRSVGQVPIFYNEKSTGRPFDPNSKWTSKYIDEANSPQWPFGFGLSYTTFEYGEPKVEKSGEANFKSPPDAGRALLTVTITVKNTGKLPGEEVAQLYVRDLVGSVTRPVKELKGFQKIMLQPGESKQLTFTLTEKDLSFYRRDMTFGTEPGEFEIMVGGNSVEVRKVKVKL
jgi:beta-glucosidase